MSDDLHFASDPDPEHPGWIRWKLSDDTLYNESVLGRMVARVEGERARVRIFPRRHLSNLAGNVHGGATLGLVDCSLFCAMKLLRGIDARGSVTIGLETQFIGAGDPAQPLDAVIEVLRETGRMAFLRGLVEQGGDEARAGTLVAAFSATLRKPSSARASA